MVMPKSKNPQKVKDGTFLKLVNCVKKHNGQTKLVCEEMGITEKEYEGMIAKYPRFRAYLANEKFAKKEHVENTDTIGRVSVVDEIEAGEASDEAKQKAIEEARKIVSHLSTEDDKHDNRYKWNLLGVSENKKEMLEGFEQFGATQISATLNISHGGLTKVLANCISHLDELEEERSKLKELANGDTIMYHQLLFANHKMYNETASLIQKIHKSIHDGAKIRIDMQKKMEEILNKDGNGNGKQPKRGKPGFSPVGK